MSNKKELEQKETKDDPFQKGWNNFIKGVRGGFEEFQKSLENQSKKNKEIWDANKEKNNKFFTDLREEWDTKIKKWNADMDKRRIETKEQWDAHTHKINQDLKNWQEKTRQEWESGVSFFKKGFFRTYLWFLLLIVPILVIIIVVIAVINWLLG